jgi:hypothetical protein
MCDIAGWVSFDRVLRSEQATADPLSAAYDRADRSSSAGPRPDQDLADRLPAAALVAPVPVENPRPAGEAAIRSISHA